MERKNKKGEMVIVKCINCKNKEAKEEYSIDADEAGMGYFCSESCRLKFALDYDFEFDVEEILEKLCLEYRIYSHDEPMRRTLSEVVQLLSTETGRKVMQQMFPNELIALKDSLQLPIGSKEPTDKKDKAL